MSPGPTDRHGVTGGAEGTRTTVAPKPLFCMEGGWTMARSASGDAEAPASPQSSRTYSPRRSHGHCRCVAHGRWWAAISSGVNRKKRAALL